MERVLELDGEWSYLPDAAGTHDPATLPESGWQTMRLPNNWELGGLHNYNGVVWFRRSFDLPPGWSDSALWLRFLAVDYFADVWLNGGYAGGHEGYFQPFEFQVNDLVRVGQNELIVRVDAPFETPGPDGWPFKKRVIKGVLSHWDARPGGTSQQHGQDRGSGGIWNSVQLVAAHKVRIRRAQAMPVLTAGVATVTFNLWIENLGPRADATITLDLGPANFAATDQTFQLQRQVRLKPGEQLISLTKTIPDPQLWSTWDHGKPNLYSFTASVEIGAEQVVQCRDRFGIRSIEVRDGWRFFLNGRQIFLRGTNVVPTMWLAEYDQAMIARDIQLMRDANLNAVRVCVHVNRPEFYDACDEAGLLIWNDFALQWAYHDTDDFKANAAEQIRDFIRLLYNHPSIIVWACQNEPVWNTLTLTPILAAVAREEDSTRLVVPAAGFDQHTYNGWYGGTKDEYIMVPAAPFNTEFGAQALPNMETMREMFDPDEIWPTTPEHWAKWAYHDFQYDQTFNVARIDRGASIEEFVANSQRYQYELLKLAMETYRANKYSRMTGFFQFMFMDAWPSITWSVVDYYRRPKLGYEALRIACQPVLIMIHRQSGSYRPILEADGVGISNIDGLTVVNDLDTPFPAAVATIWIEKDAQRSKLTEWHLDVPADGIVARTSRLETLEGTGEVADPRFREMLQASTAKLTPGDYRLILELHDAEGHLLSENHEEIKYVPLMVINPGAF